VRRTRLRLSSTLAPQELRRQPVSSMPLIGFSLASLLSEPSLLPGHKHDGSTNWAFRAGESCRLNVMLALRLRLAAADAGGRPHSLGFFFLTLFPFL